MKKVWTVCKYCGKNIFSPTTYCPHCGKDIDRQLAGKVQKEKNMDVKELREEQNKLEKDIMEYIDSAVSTFIDKTGVEVEDISVSIERIGVYGKEKSAFLYSLVTIDLDI